MRRRTTFVAGSLAIAAVAALTLAQGTKAGAGRTSSGAAAGDLPLDRWQPKKLPPLSAGITLDLIRAGDSVFHGKGGCVTCHGPDGFGMPNAGSGLTLGLHFIPVTVEAIDSLVTAGMPEDITRSSIAMPGKGAAQNLTPEETRAVAAYVWAIAQTADEPWPGGHRTHAP